MENRHSGIKNLKVLVLCNNAFIKGNGLCTAIQAMIGRLKGAGIDARLMAAVNADEGGPQPDFPLEHFKFPLFEPIIYANGFRYAKSDKKKMEAAIAWADIVHIQEAFPLEIKAIGIAKKLGKPVVGTFHLFPENVTANLGIAKYSFFSDLILYAWRDWVFNKCSHLQCPTEFVREHLLKHKFKSELHTITNGIEIDDKPMSENTPAGKLPIKILCIGRLSNEKNQETLLKAMKYSKHGKEIELHFAGKGPYFKKYRKIADRLVKDGTLSYEPKFGFYDKEELARLCSEAYLYIHCAWIEVEGLSCVEALREGIVPVIAKGALSATSQFALDDRSIYPVFDDKALAQKIDWWIDHKDEHDRMRAEYKKSASKYSQDKCTGELIDMYKKALGR